MRRVWRVASWHGKNKRTVRGGLRTAMGSGRRRNIALTPPLAHPQPPSQVGSTSSSGLASTSEFCSRLAIQLSGCGASPPSRPGLARQRSRSRLSNALPGDAPLDAEPGEAPPARSSSFIARRLNLFASASKLPWPASASAALLHSLVWPFGSSQSSCVHHLLALRRPRRPLSLVWKQSQAQGPFPTHPSPPGSPCRQQQRPSGPDPPREENEDAEPVNLDSLRRRVPSVLVPMNDIMQNPASDWEAPPSPVVAPAAAARGPGGPRACPGPGPRPGCASRRAGSGGGGGSGGRATKNARPTQADHAAAVEGIAPAP